MANIYVPSVGLNAAQADRYHFPQLPSVHVTQAHVGQKAIDPRGIEAGLIARLNPVETMRDAMALSDKINQDIEQRYYEEQKSIGEMAGVKANEKLRALYDGYSQLHGQAALDASKDMSKKAKKILDAGMDELTDPLAKSVFNKLALNMHQQFDVNVQSHRNREHDKFVSDTYTARFGQAKIDMGRATTDAEMTLAIGNLHKALEDYRGFTGMSAESFNFKVSTELTDGITKAAEAAADNGNYPFALSMLKKYERACIPEAIASTRAKIERMLKGEVDKAEAEAKADAKAQDASLSRTAENLADAGDFDGARQANRDRSRLGITSERELDSKDLALRSKQADANQENRKLRIRAGDPNARDGLQDDINSVPAIQGARLMLETEKAEEEHFQKERDGWEKQRGIERKNNDFISYFANVESDFGARFEKADATAYDNLRQTGYDAVMEYGEKNRGAIVSTAESLLKTKHYDEAGQLLTSSDGLVLMAMDARKFFDLAHQAKEAGVEFTNEQLDGLTNITWVKPDQLRGWIDDPASLPDDMAEDLTPWAGSTRKFLSYQEDVERFENTFKETLANKDPDGALDYLNKNLEFLHRYVRDFDDWLPIRIAEIAGLQGEHIADLAREAFESGHPEEIPNIIAQAGPRESWSNQTLHKLLPALNYWAQGKESQKKVLAATAKAEVEYALALGGSGSADLADHVLREGMASGAIDDATGLQLAKDIQNRRREIDAELSEKGLTDEDANTVFDNAYSTALAEGLSEADARDAAIKAVTRSKEISKAQHNFVYAEVGRLTSMIYADYKACKGAHSAFILDHATEQTKAALEKAYQNPMYGKQIEQEVMGMVERWQAKVPDNPKRVRSLEEEIPSLAKTWDLPTYMGYLKRNANVSLKAMDDLISNFNIERLKVTTNNNVKSVEDYTKAMAAQLGCKDDPLAVAEIRHVYSEAASQVTTQWMALPPEARTDTELANLWFRATSLDNIQSRAKSAVDTVRADQAKAEDLGEGTREYDVWWRETAREDWKALFEQMAANYYGIETLPDRMQVYMFMKAKNVQIGDDQGLIFTPEFAAEVDAWGKR